MTGATHLLAGATVYKFTDGVAALIPPLLKRGH